MTPARGLGAGTLAGSPRPGEDHTVCACASRRGVRMRGPAEGAGVWGGRTRPHRSVLQTLDLDSVPVYAGDLNTELQGCIDGAGHINVPFLSSSLSTEKVLGAQGSRQTKGRWHRPIVTSAKSGPQARDNARVCGEARRLCEAPGGKGLAFTSPEEKVLVTPPPEPSWWHQKGGPHFCSGAGEAAPV